MKKTSSNTVVCEYRGFRPTVSHEF